MSVAVPVPKKKVFCHLSVKLFLKKKNISISESCVTFQRFLTKKQMVQHVPSGAHTHFGSWYAHFELVMDT
jgi:hypothetical protein